MFDFLKKQPKTKDDWFKRLEKEKFHTVLAYTGSPKKKYPNHKRDVDSVYVVLDGKMTIHIDGQKKQVVTKGMRVDVPAGTMHEATMGSEGCTYIIGHR